MASYKINKMDKPIIFAIDDDPQVLRSIARDLKSKYAPEYTIITTTSPTEAIESLIDLRNSAMEISLFICDQRMPGMDGVSFLSKAMQIYPKAKRVLLTAYSDTDAAVRAINDIQLDYYLLKPWDPPEERLFPTIDDLLDDWLSEYRPDFKGIKIIGYQYSPLSHLVKDYLGCNLIPFKWLDMENNPLAKEMLMLNGLSDADLPVVVYDDGSFSTRPGIHSIAKKLGRSPELANKIYDVTIIGAGPAGLAAAVYGASEGLKTLLIERKAPGGQAGTSSRIENYLGFPKGLSGADLTRRAIAQASRLGAEFITPCTVQEIKQANGYKLVILEDGREIISRSIIVTTGVDYRRLEVEGIDSLTGAGVYYGASSTEAAACKGKPVFVLGGGNSAGQSAVYLSNFASDVYLVIRRADLSDTMSAYLIEQIRTIGNIHLLADTEITGIGGDDRLKAITLKNRTTGGTQIAEAVALYIFIGARPFTAWIADKVRCNDKGFIETGRELKANESFAHFWKEDRDPYLLETSTKGIFAAGDVRAGAMARVASAVGEGSMAISFVHKYLSES